MLSKQELERKVYKHKHRFDVTDKYGGLDRNEDLNHYLNELLFQRALEGHTNAQLKVELLIGLPDTFCSFYIHPDYNEKWYHSNYPLTSGSGKIVHLVRYMQDLGYKVETQNPIMERAVDINISWN